MDAQSPRPVNPTFSRPHVYGSCQECGSLVEISNMSLLHSRNVYCEDCIEEDTRGGRGVPGVCSPYERNRDSSPRLR